MLKYLQLKSFMLFDKEMFRKVNVVDL